MIEICLSTKSISSDEIRDLYMVERLTANQIASRFRVSRPMILSRLHAMGIKEGPASKRVTNPKNYRCRVPPYGFFIRAGKLVPDRIELKICRLVVELAERQAWPHTAVAKELEKRGFKNRSGATTWDSKTVFNIVKRWKDKL